MKSVSAILLAVLFSLVLIFPANSFAISGNEIAYWTADDLIRMPAEDGVAINDIRTGVKNVSGVVSGVGVLARKGLDYFFVRVGPSPKYNNGQNGPDIEAVIHIGLYGNPGDGFLGDFLENVDVKYNDVPVIGACLQSAVQGNHALGQRDRVVLTGAQYNALETKQAPSGYFYKELSVVGELGDITDASDNLDVLQFDVDNGRYYAACNYIAFLNSTTKQVISGYEWNAQNIMNYKNCMMFSDGYVYTDKKVSVTSVTTGPDQKYIGWGIPTVADTAGYYLTTSAFSVPRYGQLFDRSVCRVTARVGLYSKAAEGEIGEILETLPQEYYDTNVLGLTFYVEYYNPSIRNDQTYNVITGAEYNALETKTSADGLKYKEISIAKDFSLSLSNFDAASVLHFDVGNGAYYQVLDSISYINDETDEDIARWDIEDIVDAEGITWDMSSLVVMYSVPAPDLSEKFNTDEKIWLRGQETAQ